ncbi:MAG TPA: acetylornithine transaminase [Bacillota bacterium]|nr:acetylornithine transaminase [Bacillota bacterium]HOB87204.1 acetylornithine transaminase [Bacillota bacterium]HPT34670.1 acetylornithine transaminase [Bacillota bacterium]
MKIQELEANYIINTYNRKPGQNLLLVKGEGARVWDDGGRCYLDLVSGLAVNILGHCHPAVVAAVKEQVSRLIHASNLYYTEPQALLARTLVEHSPGDQVFFCNSGAEANEAAFKLARKYRPGRYKIITAQRSFHGRTLAAITATGQPKYQQGLEPLVPGFSYAEFNNLDSFRRLVDEETAAILIEPVQGEGGVYVAEEAFLKGLRRLCDDEGILLIYDEVQCGMGRTGRLWAFENWGVPPDLLTVAKGLGGGLPIGALLAKREVAAAFHPGDHASTFGGNPVVCRAALAVMDTLLAEGFLEEVRRKGELWLGCLKRLQESYPGLVQEVRGLGLMNGLELTRPLASEIQQRCQGRGLLINAIGEKVLRFLPPLVISAEELQEAFAILEQVIAGLEEAAGGENS